MTPANKGRRLPPEPLTPDEVARLLGACSTKSASGKRNRAFLVLLWRAGLRCAEALALEPKDLDTEAHTVRVLHGKGDRSRIVGLDSAAFDVVETWMEKRQELGLGGPGTPLLCSLRGAPVCPSYARKLFPRLAREAGIEKRVHAHGLRHTHAAELAREGVPVNVISRQLGHSQIGTTHTYLNHIAPSEVVDTMKRRSW
jgi:site-specific recombinase XerD